MSISVIIAAYNEEKYIESCLKSVAQQSLQPKEVLVVDDGSTDKTLKIVNSLKIDNYKLLIMRQRHLGAGAARNKGAKKARGDILVFVDADMEFDKDFLKNLTAPIRKAQTKGTFSKEEIVKNWNNPWARAWNYCLGIKINRTVPENYPDASPVFRAILKSEFVKAGGFDQKRGYDDDWSLSEKLGYQASLVNQAKYYHYNPDSLKEIFFQARWRASRRYKYGILGKIFELVRVTFFNFRVIKAIYHRSLHFYFANLAFNLGTVVGILSNLTIGKTSK